MRNGTPLKAFSSPFFSSPTSNRTTSEARPDDTHIRELRHLSISLNASHRNIRSSASRLNLVHLTQLFTARRVHHWPLLLLSFCSTAPSLSPLFLPFLLPLCSLTAMSLLCSLTGQVAVHPVLNPKSGRVYEKAMIEQHLLTSSTDPNTQEPLTFSDLIPIHPSALSLPPFLSSPSPSTLSLSSLLSSLQREYDGLMLEQFSLKRDVHSLKQELAHSLYQYDAACRVIARLLRERDEAREALRSGMGIPTEAKQQHVEEGSQERQTMEVEGEQKEGEASLDSALAEVKAHFEATSDRLGGKKRKVMLKEKAATAVKKEDVARFAVTHSVALHGAAVAGVSALDVHERAEGERLLLTGGMDGSVSLFDMKAGRVTGDLKGHKKKVTGVAFVTPTASPPSTGHLPLLSSSADHTVLLHSFDSEAGHYTPSMTWADHTASITALSLHPSALYFATASLDSSYHLYSLTSLTPVLSLTTPSPLTSLLFHPDGRIIATTHSDHAVRIYDPLTSQCIVSLTSHKAPPSAVAFSPNGYQAVSGDGGGIVRVWDLRKVSGEKESNVMTLELGLGVGALGFDEGGGVLGVGFGNEVMAVESKGWEELVRWKEHKDEVKALKWGRNGQWLATASKDRTVKVWENKE